MNVLGKLNLKCVALQSLAGLNEESRAKVLAVTYQTTA